MDKKEYPELLNDIGECINKALLAGGIEKRLSSKAAWSAMEEIRRNWGGSLIYIPKGSFFELSERDKRIYEDFDGKNYVLLAVKYNLSEMRVRSIIKEMRRYYRDKRQLPLFGEEENPSS